MLKKTILVLTLASSLNAATNYLGVVYDPVTDNTVSPSGLKIGTFNVITNLYAQGAGANKVVVADNAKKLIESTLTTNQAHSLSLMVGTNTLIYLGTPSLSSGSGAPTNGTAGIVNGSLYFRTGGATINESLYVSLNTNWYSLASTNGGSITESQFNFTDVTTADSTTNQHGLFPKLSGISTEYLNGIGVWAEVPSINGSMVNSDIPYYFGAEFFPSGLRYAAGTVTARTNLTVSGVTTLNGTNTANVLTVTNWGGTTIGDVSTTQHGLVPVAPNDSAQFLNGLGAWAVPPGGGTNTIGLTGSPAAAQMAYFTGTNTISGVVGSSIGGSTLTIPTLIVSSGGLSLGSTATNGNVYSGTFTPVLSSISGADQVGVTAYDSRYTRVGSQITVSGLIQVRRTGSGSITFEVDFPINSTSVDANDLSGYGRMTGGLANLPSLDVAPVIITPNAGGTKAKFWSIGASTSGTTRNIWYSYNYIVQ
jgi:hypothetical protein